ncbi:hypothetical protein BB560_006801 [Smittium megazygosporum]|uniref:W2 domain-containing protein n=1 Tax=Smittium megazygosporum TaxID=133381 RepID=A0A2T9Y1G0_9FUNG|nr:hypothetical protein BB560_006801 [Smittium megazygosporum]
MSVINIRRDIQDSYYRYKMPKLLSKIEGKGNGIKTVIPNMSEIARSLSRPPEYPTKYFGTELGAQVKFESKNDRYIVNGAHSADKLQDLLYGFIEKFVLCGNCKNPETNFVIKDNVITKKCLACGKTSSIDMSHRLSTYILKNPPQLKKSSGQHASSDLNTNGLEESANTTGDDQDELTRQIHNGISSLKFDENLDDDDWGNDIDVSEEAVARRQRELAGNMKDLDEYTNRAKDPLDVFGDFISEGGHDDIEILKKAKELGLSKKHRALIVIILTLFVEKDILAQIKKHTPLLLSFGDTEKCQKAILGGFERFMAENAPSLIPKSAHILKSLYENDLVDEEVILQWAEKPSKKYVDRETSKEIHMHAERFIQWLREAEDDSEDDSEDEG